MKVLDHIVTYGRMIKFSHSIFALPFAFSGAALASRTTAITPQVVAWIVLAMVGARSAAMGFNRLVDRGIDAENPRTASRELPRGVISLLAVEVFIVIVFFYSYTKRFTWATQVFLGLSLAVAPIGAWIAVTGRLDPAIFLLGGAVLAWVAGFDIIYACQDTEFDRRFGLRSIPQRFGVRRALIASRLLHALSFGLMVAVGWTFSLGTLYAVGVAIVGGLLVYEHRLVRHDDLSKAAIAFMNLNATISTVYFLFTLGDVVFL